MSRVAYYFPIFLITFSIGCWVANLFLTPENKYIAPARTYITTDQTIYPLPTYYPPASITAIEDDSASDRLNIHSPRAIAAFINAHPRFEIDRLWTKLRIAGQVRITKGFPGKDYLGLCGNCKAQTFDFPDQGRRRILLRVADDLQEACRYLVFESVADSRNSHLIGFVDHGFGQYEMPMHQFVSGAGQVFLVVRVQTASGSGVAMYINRLFAIWHSKLVELFDFPAEGHKAITTSVPDRNVSGRVATIHLTNGKVRIEIALKAVYSKWDDDKKKSVFLFTKRSRAVYDWIPRSKAAIFNRSASNVSKAEIDNIFGLKD